MGHRSNLVLIENNEPKIFYSKGAQQTPNILAQGLDYCEKYFKRCYYDGWLMDNAFAEGGILIDKDNKEVLIFGGVEIAYTPALQRLYCKHIVKVWKGWNVRWCHKGNEDFANYLGIMEDRILADGCIPEFSAYSKWSYTMNADRTQEEVITIINDDTINDYKQDWGLDGINMCIAKGEILKDIIPNDLKIVKWHNEIETTDCLLVDYNKRILFVCWGEDKDSRHDIEIKEIWKGWQVQRQADGLLFHFDYTNRDRKVVEMTDEQFEVYAQEHNLFKLD